MEEGNHSTDSTTKAQHVVELEELFAFYASHAAVLNSHRFDRSLGRVQERCNALFARDYEVHLLSNPRGELCDSYPVELIIPQQELFVPQPTVVNEGRNMEDLFVEACWARSRSRFPVPVLIFNNRNICRSGALAEAAEIGIRSKAVLPVKTKEKLRFRGMDAEVLRKLSVTHICDLMVDHKMKVMGVTTATSEHLSAEIYANDFTLVHIPYPGVDLYKTWSIGGCNTQGLCANWNKMSVQISVPPQFSFVEWRQCTSWGMITLTQNYLKTMLYLLVNPRTEDKGLLVHCVSGWDRTPLWISLLRLSLWADGVVHPSLSAEEMLYLTVGYDWLLFGHNLLGRCNKSEEIFYWYLSVCSFIADEQFSIFTAWAEFQQRSSPASSSSSSSNKEQQEQNDFTSRYPRCDAEERKRRIEAYAKLGLSLYQGKMRPLFRQSGSKQSKEGGEGENNHPNNDREKKKANKWTSFSSRFK